MSQLIENGQLIQGDFSAVPASRKTFKTTVQNSGTFVQAKPDGTATSSAFISVNSSDVANASAAAIVANPAEVTLWSGKYGTGAYLPIAVSVSGVSQWQFDTSGRMLNSSLSMPAFHANRSTQLNSGFNVICDTEFYDYGAAHDTSAGTFTAPVTGFYIFSGGVMLKNATGSDVASIGAAIQNTTRSRTYAQSAGILHNGANNAWYSVATAPVYLIAGDVIRLTVTYSLSATLTCEQAFFIGSMVR